MGNRINFLVIAAMLVLASCATDVVEKPSEVDVPVAVQCNVITPPPPDFATASVTPGTRTPDKAKALVAADQQHKGYEIALNSAIAACQ